MKSTLVLIQVAALTLVKATLVATCPKLSCEDSDFATDLDDWCVRVNIDKERPA